MEQHANGRIPDDERATQSSNPYAEAVERRRPPELVRYELNTDPYANMVPRPDRLVTDDPVESHSTRNPAMVALSVALILVLLLPVMAQVFEQLFH